MATVNLLRAVQLYTDSALGMLQNQNPWIFKSNKRYREFNADYPLNLGSTITFDKPVRYQPSINTGLVVTFQPTVQPVISLTVDQDASVAPAFTDQEIIFNVENKLEDFVKSAVNVIGNKIGANIALNAETGPYRMFGDGVTPISTYEQYAQAIANFNDYSAVQSNMCMFVDSVSIPAAIASGLQEFATNRNNDIANSWVLGKFMQCDFYQTNLLPVHTAGVVGEEATELTVTNAVNGVDAYSNPVTTLTLSGGPISETIAIAKDDILTFDPPDATNNVGLFFLNYAGYTPSSQKVQAKAIANAASNGSGVITVTVSPALIFSATDPNANLNKDLTPLLGDLNVTIPPSHRCGLLQSGDPLFLAMPRLPDKSPYMTAISVDKESGASLRTYRGSTIDTNQTVTVTQALWGSTFAPDYGMRIAYPISSVMTFSAAFGKAGSLQARHQAEQKRKIDAASKAEEKRRLALQKKSSEKNKAE